MDKKELRPGDVLVFRAGDNWVSKAIAWLTDSKVSHAAMMLDNGEMVEMGMNGIAVGPVEAREGQDAILLRLSPEQPTPPLVSAAQKYIDSKTRYDFPALAFLAGLLIYRRVRPTPRFVVITDTILRLACVALDKLIQSMILKNPDKALVCSQLVYQVYADCGKAYHIKIEDGLLQAAGDDDGICLADLAATAPDLDMDIDMELTLSASPPDEEGLARELYLALTEPETANGPLLAANDLGVLPARARIFQEILKRLEELLENSKYKLPIDALFITPADLASKATNLELVGELGIVRTK